MSETAELKRLFSSSGVTTKDRIMSLRVEEALYRLLEELTEEWKTETVSMTLRVMLALFFIPAIYEEEWRNTQQENLSEFLSLLAAEGKSIEFERYKKLLEELSKYTDFLNKMVLRFKASEEFFSSEVDKVGSAIQKLETAQINWKGEILERERKMENENEPVS